MLGIDERARKGARSVGGFDPSAFHEIPSPATKASTTFSRQGPTLTPKQHVYFYSSDEWEEFILEWASAVSAGYVQVKRMGGAGDRGADIAAFTSALGFEAEWDCFQGKHYSRPLNLSDALPEILKVLRHAAAGHYKLPSSYAFSAPQGVGPSLSKLLSSPSKLQEQFLARLVAGDKLVEGMEAAELDAVSNFARRMDFSIFSSLEIDEMLRVHRTTPHHVIRFGGPLPPRGTSGKPPASITANESRYVEQLVDVYREEYGDESLTIGTLASNASAAKHFKRQRQRFFQAESLRLYARDSVPDGTFETLQDDVHAGVIDVAEMKHSTAFTRMTQVLNTSGSLDLSSHALISVANQDDRRGICHQLANVDRLTWRNDE
jgi:hypothetical protein